LASRPPDREDLIGIARGLADRIALTASLRDRVGGVPREPVTWLSESGVTAARVPVAYGGGGIDWPGLVQIILHLATADSSVAQILQPHFIFLERVALMGTERQRRRYLPAAAAGAVFGNAMSERGEKFYATGALVAEWVFVGARLPDGARAIAVVPIGRPGFRLAEDWDGMGQRATASGTAAFDDVAVAADELILLAPWERRRHHTGTGSQIIHAAIDAGIALAALRDAVATAQARSTAPADPLVQHCIGGIAAQVHAAEAMVLRAAGCLERAANAMFADHPDPETLLVAASIATAEAKIVCTEAALRASERLYEVAGASATSRAKNLDRHWRNARTHTLHDPLAQKFQVIGAHLLSGQAPPISFTF
jgi:alkylation response protein AidB-like acyl-CoA dehydrogenase